MRLFWKLLRQLSQRQKALGALLLLGFGLLLATLIPRRQEISLPAAEAGFVNASMQARDAWVGAPNDLARIGMRQARAAALCRAVPGLAARDWEGWIQSIAPNPGPDFAGKASARIVIALTDHLTLSTPGSPLLNLPDMLVEADSPVYAAARTLKPGQRVRFSARFPASPHDCMAEESFTTDGSLRNPDFRIVLSALGPA
jgi:hypothetical protein